MSTATKIEWTRPDDGVAGATRLAHLKDIAFTPAEWADALHAASPADRVTIDALLRRGV